MTFLVKNEHFFAAFYVKKSYLKNKNILQNTIF